MQLKLSDLSNSMKRMAAKIEQLELSSALQEAVTTCASLFRYFQAAAIYKLEGIHWMLQSMNGDLSIAHPAFPDDCLHEVEHLFQSIPDCVCNTYPIMVHGRQWGQLLVLTEKAMSVEERTCFDMMGQTIENLTGQYYSQMYVRLHQNLFTTSDSFADLSEWLPHFVRQMNVLIHFDLMMLTVPNPHMPSDMHVYGYHPSGQSSHFPESLPLIHSKTETTLIEKMSRIDTYDSPTSPKDSAVFSVCNYKSVIRIPLLYQDEPLAVLHLYSSKQEHYGLNEINDLDQLMRSMSLYIHQLIQKQQLRVRELFHTISNRLNEEILSSSDLIRSASKIAKMTKKLLHFDDMLIWFLDAESFILKSVQSEAYNLSLTDSDVISSILYNKKTIFFNEIQDLNWVSTKLSDIQAKSILLSPIVDSRDNHVIGIVLLIDNKNSYRFNQSVSVLCDDLISSKGGPIAHLMMRRDLERSNLTMIKALTIALDKKDSETQGHSERVVSYSVAIAREMKLSETEINKIRLGALLHDIGKIGIPDAILLKKGKLTLEEWEVMRTHPIIGFEMVKDIEFLEGAIDIVLYHHERFDGKGYPHNLHGLNIPLGARIFALADAFDAITSNRPYRQAHSIDKAREIISECVGSQFCSQCAQAFLSIPQEVLREIRQNHNRKFLIDLL